MFWLSGEISALAYHELTKHSEEKLQFSRPSLDWNNRPFPFKVYREMAGKSLPGEFPDPMTPTFQALQTKSSKNAPSNLTLDKIAELLFYSGGITRITRTGVGPLYMRAASATGALYPIEIYIATRELPQLEQGIYHFGVADFSLTKIRSDPKLHSISKAVGDSESVLSSQAIFFFTSIAWRNSWKYEERSYRHWYWDGGTLLANFLAIAEAESIPYKLIVGFIDQEINDLLLLEAEKEATIAAVAVGMASNPLKAQIAQSDTGTKIPASYPLSTIEARHQVIWDIHKKTSIFSSEGLRSWTSASDSCEFSLKGGASDRFDDYSKVGIQKSLRDTILMRGSSRRFSTVPIRIDDLSRILYSSLRGMNADFLKNSEESFVYIYLIVNSVEGLTPGSYYYQSSSNSLLQLKSGTFRRISGYLCLGQSLFSDASVLLFLMADLTNIISHFGDRGYRMAQLEGGMVAGKLYLSSYALGLGASGSTFFDDDVTTFFSPHAEKKDTLIAVGIGIPGYKAKSGRKLPIRLSREKLEELATKK